MARSATLTETERLRPSEPPITGQRPGTRLDAFLVAAGRNPLVMGILNVTPDSFSDGGRFDAVAAAVARAEAMVAEGAAIIDIGGESTRPGFAPVGAQEEWRRIGPVIATLAGRLAVPLSVDTTKAVVARRALAAGAALVNDIWGFQGGDPDLPAAVAEAGAGAVLMHNRHAIDPDVDIGEDMARFFDRSLRVAESAGVSRERLMLDPGIGFGKTHEQQFDAIRAVADLKVRFGLPMLVGLSKKRFLGAITGAPVERRGTETVAANLAALATGATVFRVHDVAEHVAALAVFGLIAGFPR